jgi:hypothetical protein
MRHIKSIGLGLLGLVASIASALAEGPPPATTACPEALNGIATCYLERLASGAYVRAALPANWNGNLIVFAHGGPFLVPPTANSSANDVARFAFLVKSGHAWVGSSFRREGYGVQMAVADSEDARRFFVERIGKPRHTIMHGQSYGGMVAAKLIEAHAKNSDGSLAYDGALFNSGFMAGAPLGYEFRADLRAVYQYYCKNLPGPDEPPYPLWSGLPAESKLTLKDLGAAIDACTGIEHPAEARSDIQKKNLANIIGVMRFSEAMLVRHMQAATFTYRDIAERITNGRSAFSNIGIMYSGSNNDTELNREVARFAADPAALAALKADGDPSGVLPVPVVSIHSLNDPQVAVEVQSAYLEAVERAGGGDRLVQAFTDERAHGGQSEAELGGAIAGLVQWIEKGTKPVPQGIAAACTELLATVKGPCRYHPDYSPKPYATRFYPREVTR